MEYVSENLDRLNISEDEFLMELRLKGAEHLGQIRLGLVEVDGQLSLYFYPDEAVRAGLSVLPEAHRHCFTQIPETGLYACNRCGTTREIPGYEEPRCPKCGRNTWSLALNKKRV
ncbi:YetF domain-containing protein [Pantoea sp. Seng]|uniref:YetF domain-containing protein n=1 Tax=Pantoea sp. Seng TaxID=2576761 RepID=UPI00351AC91C